jgi:hypothetical protein
MAKVTFDVSGSDPDKATQDQEPPKPGVYVAKVDAIETGFSKDEETGKPDKSRPRLEVIYRIAKGPSKGFPLWDYLSFSEASQWKMDQFLQAVGVATKTKRKGSFETSKIVGKKLVKVRLSGQGSGDDYRVRVRGVFSYNESEDEGEEEEEELEDEEEEELEDEESEEEEEETEDEDEIELDESDLDQLGAEADAGGTPGEKAAAKLEELAEAAGIDPNQYATWAEVATALQEAESEEEEADEYDSWSIAQLKKELRKRELPVTGTQAKLIARLREADSGDPF